MKTIQISCPNCNAKLELEEEFIGQTCECPLCKHEFVAQKPADTASIRCLKCGKELASSAKFCDGCGTPVGQTSSSQFKGAVHSASKKFNSAVAAATGLDKSVGFSFKSFFSEVFKKHSDADYQEVFCRGYESNTPTLDQIDGAWPKPWVFSRVLGFALLSFAILVATLIFFPNPNLIPGILFMGPVAFQISMMFFFYEMNILKNTSLPKLCIVFFVIGVISLLITLYFNDSNIGKAMNQNFGDIAAGPIEELAKLCAVLFFCDFSKKQNSYILNGMLLGAAVGAGFSAFESAGYALQMFINGKNFVENILMRSLLQLAAGHTLWTAMCAGAFWKVKGKHKFNISTLWNWNFLRIAFVAVGSHMLNNSSLFILDNEYAIHSLYIRGFVIGIIDWAVVIALLKTGINQVVAMKHESKAQTSETVANV